MKIGDNDNLKMYKVHGTNGEAELRPLVFKISKTLCSPSVENLADASLKENFEPDDVKHAGVSSVFAMKGNEELSSVKFESGYPEGSEDVPTLIDEDGAKSTNPAETDYSLKDGRTGQEPRRSLRLLALQSRIKVERKKYFLSFTLCSMFSTCGINPLTKKAGTDSFEQKRVFRGLLLFQKSLCILSISGFQRLYVFD